MNHTLTQGVRNQRELGQTKRFLKLRPQFGIHAVAVGERDYRIGVVTVTNYGADRVTKLGPPMCDIRAIYEPKSGAVETIRLSAEDWKTNDEASEAMRVGFWIGDAENAASAEVIVQALIRDGNAIECRK